MYAIASEWATMQFSVGVGCVNHNVISNSNKGGGYNEENMDRWSWRREKDLID